MVGALVHLAKALEGERLEIHDDLLELERELREELGARLRAIVAELRQPPPRKKVVLGLPGRSRLPRRRR